MIDFFEFCQYAATGCIFVGIIPEYIKIFKAKSKATNALSVTTGALFVLDSLLRLPNIGNGLFNAIRIKDTRQIQQLSLAAAGVFIMGISFYGLIVLQAIYNSDATKTSEYDKHVASILMIVYGLCILALVIYFIFGFTGSAIATIVVLSMAVIYGILVIYGKKGIDEVEKKKKISQILTGVYSLALFGICAYYYKGIKNSVEKIIKI